MLYRKNLPGWERLARIVAGLAMAACGLYTWGTVAGWVFLAAGVVSAVTALVGYCPACALGGRRALLPAQNRARP